MTVLPAVRENNGELLLTLKLKIMETKVLTTVNMKKIRVIYTWQEWRAMFRRTLKLLFQSLFCSLWAVILLFVNLADRAVKTAVRAVRSYPCVSVGVTIAAMTVVILATHASMKYKLTTAEHQRDSLIIKIDSIKVLNGDKVSYFRYKSY